MSFKGQEGIYYRKKPSIGNSFCILSLRAESSSDITKVGKAIKSIWDHLTHLKKGVTVDLKIDSKHRKVGNLTVLLAYGPNIFELPDPKRKMPSTFSDSLNFKPPDPAGGGQIYEGSGMSYSPLIYENHLLRDHIVFQFIADGEFYTKRACVEVWKALYILEKETGHSLLRISGVYTGFQRADQRNWLGFHDGVSNLKSHERPYVIFIDPRAASTDDKWIVNGTYLAFIRIGLDLKRWEDTPVTLQEIAIGRDKLTGCPLIRVDKNKKPIKDSRCPVPGTSEVIDRGNESFREHPPYGIRTEDKILEQSHIASTRPIDRVPPGDKKSLQIYRQGFEFLDASRESPRFLAGLNFVSFQNTPERLFRALTYRHTFAQRVSEIASTPNLEEFMSVIAAGVFFVPPVVRDEPFPGAQIFFNSVESRYLSRTMSQKY
jgi:Dyp-type peroxidase family